MDTQVLESSTGAGESINPTAPWPPWLCVAFRFCLVYFGLFCVGTQTGPALIAIPTVELPDPATLPPFRQIVLWSATHIFKTSASQVDTGSGDKAFDWVLAFCLLVVAFVATIVWSLINRKRWDYVSLSKWFRVFLRFCRAGQLIVYGMDKVVPLQMSTPSLFTLVEPFGSLSPMGVLWRSIGVSRGYEAFVGSAELLGGLLLIVPRTAMLGALVALIDMTEVFVLNMTYDVPVKLFSFHLLLMSLFLLAPELGRLANFFFLNRPTPPSTQPLLFPNARANRVAGVVQICFGAVLLGSSMYQAHSDWYRRGGGSPKSPLYGIWEVQQMSIDGQTRLPLINDSDRWRRAIFQAPKTMAFQRMDESFARYGVALSEGKLALTKSDDKNWKASFFYQRPAQDQLVMDGAMDGHQVHMRLQLVDHSKFLLVSRGFHWVQEYPFNR